MKYTKKQLIFIPILIIACSFVHGQSPQQFSYQAVVRDNNNQLIPNRTIGMRVSILRDSTNGQIAYVETHSPKTNQQGIIQLNIGAGTLVSGSFASIPWSTGKIFVKTDMDLLGGSNYTVVKSSQLTSVPYAMYASDIPVSKSGDTLSVGKSRLVIPGAQLLTGSPSLSLSNGLIGYWPFNGNANDESGNSINGKISGAILTSDRFGNANRSYFFDGINDFIDLGNSLNNIQTFSFSCWFLREATGQRGAFCEIFSKENCFSFSINNDGNKYHVNFANGNFWDPPPFLESTSNVVDLKWNNITVTRNMPSGETKLYYNGKLENSKTITTSGTNTLPLYIGSKIGVYEPWFFGKIDDIRVYNRVLTAEEIAYLANN